MPRTMRERVKLHEDAGNLVVHQWSHDRFYGSLINDVYNFEIQITVEPSRSPSIGINWPGCGSRGTLYAIGMAGALLHASGLAEGILSEMKDPTNGCAHEWSYAVYPAGKCVKCGAHG